MVFGNICCQQLDAAVIRSGDEFAETLTSWTFVSCDLVVVFIFSNRAAAAASVKMNKAVNDPQRRPCSAEPSCQNRTESAGKSAAVISANENLTLSVIKYLNTALTLGFLLPFIICALA